MTQGVMCIARALGENPTRVHESSDGGGAESGRARTTEFWALQQFRRVRKQ